MQKNIRYVLDSFYRNNLLAHSPNNTLKIAKPTVLERSKASTTLNLGRKL